MKIRILGTMSPIATDGHNCPGVLIESGNSTILLDCGSGTHSMVDFHAISNDLHIFLSHLHTDHFSDVFNYQLASFVYRNLNLLLRPINIYMPKSPDKDASYISSQDLQFAEYGIISSNAEYHIGHCCLSFCQTVHPVETYAVKIREADRKIVYTSDTSFDAHDKLVDFAQGADLLIAEASLLKEHNSPSVNSHLTAEQAGIIAKNAKAKKLMLTHFWHNEDIQKYVEEAKRIFYNVVPATEDLSFTI